MELSNEFDVGVPVDQAWELLTDLERIAPCLPGAQLQEIEGEEYRGIVKIKVGPITAQYKGSAHFVEQDAAAHKAVLTASGRDTRGQGNASAAITAELTSKGESSTHVSVLTDLTITGKVAQFGRGVIGDVSEKLLGQFVQNLETMILEDDASGSPAAAVAEEVVVEEVVVEEPVEQGTAASVTDKPSDETTQLLASELAQVWNDEPDDTVRAERPTLDPRPDLLVTGGDGSGAAAPAASSGVRKIDAPEPEAIDLLDAAGSSVGKRLVPLLGVLAVLLVILGLRRRRRSR